MNKIRTTIKTKIKRSESAELKRCSTYTSSQFDSEVLRNAHQLLASTVI